MVNGVGIPSAQVDIYNSTSNTWSTASLSQARFNLATTTVGNLAIFGEDLIQLILNLLKLIFTILPQILEYSFSITSLLDSTLLLVQQELQALHNPQQVQQVTMIHLIYRTKKQSNPN